MILSGSGIDLVAVIRQSARALIFVDVPWSDEARDARKVFAAAAQVLRSIDSGVEITVIQLDVHQDEIVQRWVKEQGFPEFIEMGAGNLLWTQAGCVVATESSVNALGVDGVVARTLSLWSPKKREIPTPTRLENFISKVSAICNVCVDAACIGIVVVLSSLQFFAAAKEDKIIPFGMYAFVCMPIAFIAVVYAWGSRRGFGVIAALLLFCWATYTFVEFVYMGLKGFAG
jgi:hypothetical protein